MPQSLQFEELVGVGGTVPGSNIFCRGHSLKKVEKHCSLYCTFSLPTGGTCSLSLHTGKVLKLLLHVFLNSNAGPGEHKTTL